jgi:hypothetical protein
MTTAISLRPATIDAPARLIGSRRVLDLPVLTICATTAAAAAVMFWAIHYNLTDDGYITLAYAKQLAFHGDWGMVPGRFANSATSPLNVLLIAFGTVVTRRPLLGLGITYVAAFTVLAWTTARTARALDVPLVSSVVAVALVFVNPVVLASTGLESVVYAALLGALLCCAVEDRPALFGVAAGLALLCRLDTIVFIVPFLLCTASLRRHLLKSGGLAIATALPWFIGRWFAGSAIPDTFVIKTLQHSFGVVTFWNRAFRFMDDAGEVSRWSFVPMFMGAAAFAVWLVVNIILRFDRRFLPVAALGVGGIAYYGTYSLLNVPPYHWYFSPPIACAAIVLAFVIGDAVRRLRQWNARLWPWALALFVLPGLVVVRQTIVVAHHGLPWRERPITYGNLADPDGYRALAAGLRYTLGHEKVAAGPGEIGILAFYCDCQVVDPFADQHSAVPLIERRIDDAGSVMRALLKLNYHYLDRSGPPAVDYYVEYGPGWVTGSYVWNVWSPTKHFGHFRLVQA